MLKNLLNSCFDAYRGSHKSVVAGRHIATDISFPTGYENVNATTYVPPCDGVFVIQCEPAEDYAYCNLTVRRDQFDCGIVGSSGQTWPVLETPCRKGETIHWFMWVDGAAQNIKAHIRFYPYIGS
jgi:hypothetical protein